MLTKERLNLKPPSEIRRIFLASLVGSNESELKMEFVIFTFGICFSSLEISHDIVEGDIILSLIE